MDGRGLAAMYPMNPNHKPGSMMSHGAKRHPWSTRWWVEESKGKKVEVEVEAWTAMPSMEIWTGVEWGVSGQWKRMPGVDVRLMEHAEHDDVDEMNASLVVVGS